jgi:hypothetical protein
VIQPGKGTCASCRFFAKRAANGGECRCNPPEPGRLGQWPDVLGDQWCGKGQWSEAVLEDWSQSVSPRFR